MRDRKDYYPQFILTFLLVHIYDTGNFQGGYVALNPELLLVKLMEIAGAIFYHPGN